MISLCCTARLGVQVLHTELSNSLRDTILTWYDHLFRPCSWSHLEAAGCPPHRGQTPRQRLQCQQQQAGLCSRMTGACWGGKKPGRQAGEACLCVSSSVNTSLRLFCVYVCMCFFLYAAAPALKTRLCIAA